MIESINIQPDAVGAFWIGARYAEDGHRWEDGSTVDLNNWDYPVSGFCKSHKRLYGNDTLILGFSCVDTTAPDGTFRTAPCSTENYFICEIDENGVFSRTEGGYRMDNSLTILS